MNRLYIVFVAMCLSAWLPAQKKSSPKMASAVLSGTTASISLKGEAVFHETKKGMVVLTVRISGLNPLSKHGIHIHEKGDCSDAGKAAGAHWNPTHEMHGQLVAMDKKKKSTFSHRGDVGNLVVNEAGEATLTLSTKEWCIGCADSLKNVVGKSIIIHEGEDDFKTQPTGGSGGRIGCGVIVETKATEEQ